MWKISKYITILFFLSGIFFNVFALEKDTTPEQIRLNYITTKEGLPQNTVDCILKDSSGFMWFGTWNGLCRYDGYTFKTYQKNNEKIVLPSNFIQTLCEDNLENLWVGTDKGLALFDHNLLEFIELKSLAENLGHFPITHIIKNSNNDLWIATAENGLWKISTQKNGTTQATKVSNKLLPVENINRLCILTDNNLMVATSNGIAIIDPGGTSNVSAWNNLATQIGGIRIETIYQDSKENIWIGTFDSGLYYFNRKTSQLLFFGADNNILTDLNHLSVKDIIEDKNGTVIVGTLGGLNYFDDTNNTFSHISENIESEHFLNSPFVNSLYADDLGNIWIGTEKGGVNYYNTFQKPFYAIKHEPSNINTISHNTINSILKEKNNLWIGTAGGGLNKVSANRKQITIFELEPGKRNSISSNFISSLLRDKNKNLWIGTWGGGLDKLLSEHDKQFGILVNNPNVPTSLCNNFVSYLEELHVNKILVGTNNGLDVFNTQENTFIHVHEKMNLKNPLEVGCLLTDNKSRVWVGTRNGLYRFNKTDLLNISSDSNIIAFDKFENQTENAGSLSGNYVISLYESKDGSIWIGTYGNGICKYIEEDGHFINYNEQQGLCNNVNYAIEEDSNGNLWISTDKGLSKFNPETETFQNFYTNDGLLSDQFYWSASFADDDGILYFGGVEGLNYFNPTQIEPYPNTPNVVFTEFSIFSKPVQIGEKYHLKVVLSKPVNETNTIELSYKDAVFSIEFSALDFFLPQKIIYAYKMEGVDQDWVTVPSTRRFANYTNLSGGEYLFQVKATNNDGVWSEKIAQLQIIIKPPFWGTLWFQMLAFLAIVLVVMAYIRSRTRFLNEQKRKLEKLVKERTHKIEEQNEELEKQNKQIAKQRDEVIELNEKVNLVNQLRLRFFTNISHEFRTPLTLIIDPLEQLMQNFKHDINAQNTISIINRNAQRLLNLINQLLYFRRIETGKLKLNIGKGDMSHFLFGIFESFKDLAVHQQIDYQFISNNANAETWFDSEKIENVFYNLLSNAFKNTPVSGRIKMLIEFVQTKRESCIPSPFVSISINDSGTGIAKEDLPHIFDRFYKAEQKNKDSDFTSSGIGLALTYEIVQALHGEIKVESQPGIGSSFTVCIPYTKDRFVADEIKQASAPTDINIEGRVNVLSDHIIARASDYEREEDTPEDKSKPTVLIVEDNFDLRSFLLQTFRSDYRMLGAENGKIGFEMAKKYSPELIISDVMMPVMDGFELCSRLKKNIQTSHIPVVLLTAKNMVENLIEGLETGADDYIPKPFTLQILQVKMRNLIESRRKIKQMFSSPDKMAPNQLSNNAIDEEFISKVYTILEKNYERKDFSIDQLASEMCVSRSLLYKKIKALTDLNIIDFINTYKLKKAVALMRNKNLSISEVAFESGFNDPKYFSRIFKKFYGVSPSEIVGVNVTF